MMASRKVMVTNGEILGNICQSFKQNEEWPTLRGSVRNQEVLKSIFMVLEGPSGCLNLNPSPVGGIFNVVVY